MGNHFVIKDADGFSLAYIYQREGPGMYPTYFTDEEAFVMANTIAKLPERKSGEGASPSDAKDPRRPAGRTAPTRQEIVLHAGVRARAAFPSAPVRIVWSPRGE